MQSTENTERTSHGPRGHRPASDARPVNRGDDGRWGDAIQGASPELGTAPWWADDANVDGCEITLRVRA
jgi:hypothetical protein